MNMHEFCLLLIDSSVEDLERRGQMSRSRAQQVHSYLQHSFNPQMIGALTWPDLYTCAYWPTNWIV